MHANLPVWKYYDKDFVDPLYVPYQDKQIRTTTNGNCNSGACGSGTGEDTQVCPVNTWVTQGCNAMVNPALVRQGWGQSFQRAQPFISCPPGFTEGVDGWCFPSQREFEPIFYSDKQRKMQSYENGYAKSQQTKLRQSSDHSCSTDIRKYWSEPKAKKSEYLKYPVKNSYIGN